MSLLVDRLKSRLGLLVLLATALAGFVLLLNILVSLVATGPPDLLAANPSDERTIDIPNGVGLVTLAVVVVSVILGVAALAFPSHWTLRNGVPRPRSSLAIGAAIALVVLGMGMYMAFSGMLSQDIPYEEHHVQRDLVKPVGLVALAAFILSVAIVGIINPRFLIATLVFWLLAAIAFGLFSSSGLAGLKLFMRPSEIETSPAYAAEVEKRRTTEDPAPRVEVSISDPIPESKPPLRSEGVDTGTGDTPADAAVVEGNAALISALAQLVAGIDPEVRASAARTLGQFADESALNALIDAAINDTNPEVRAAALEALAGLDIEQLVRTLMDHDEPWMRAAAAAVLGELQGQEAADPLQESLAGDLSPEVRAAAAEALGKLLDEDAAELLSDVLLSDEYAEVREAAAAALGNMHPPEGLDPLTKARDGDESFDVRATAGAALEQYPLSDLTDALREETDPGAKAAAAQLLGGLGDPESVPSLIEALDDRDPEVSESAKEALEELGNVDWLENGSGILTQDAGPGNVGSSASFIPRGTDSQASPVPHVPVFQVTGASRTRYLRTTVGQGKLGITAPRLELPHDETDLPVQYAGPPSEATVLPISSHAERITVVPAGRLSQVPAGVVPTSYGLKAISVPGAFHPHNGVFVSENPVIEYSWSSTVAEYSRAQLDGAAVFSDPAYTFDLRSERIRELAREITATQTTPYSKAKAIETYLKTNYVYRFADPSGKDLPPPGQDPVDWFLFEHQEGTCGNFSSAFVALALSVGLPARTVSGWAITPTADAQMVYTDQAHQWAEVAFDGLGWIGFEPTASGGAPTRVTPVSERFDTATPGSTAGDPTDQAAQSQTLETTPATGPSAGDPPSQTAGSSKSGATSTPEPSVADKPGQASQPPKADPAGTPDASRGAVAPTDTVTEITGWPERMLRDTGFPIDGTVMTASGRPVTGMEVEVFINETKEHGGIRIGTGVVQNGLFTAEVEIPKAMGRGGYQLIAHAIGNDRYGESWSDPDITVYSESGLELTGPAEIAVDVQAVFRGKLSEDTGGGVAGEEVQIIIDGRQMSPQSTGPSGDFSFTTVFSEPGNHRVEVAFDDRDGGGSFLTGSTARLELTAVMPTELTIEVPVQVEVGKDFEVSGLLRDVRGIPMPGETVTVTIGDGPSEPIETGPGGDFLLMGSADSAGELTIHAEFAGELPVLSSNGSARLIARHLTYLFLEGRGAVMQGEDAEFSGIIASDTHQKVGPVDLILADFEGNSLGSVTTGDDGSFSHSIPSVDTTGPHRTTASFAGTDFLTASSASVSFSVLAPTTLTVEGPRLVKAGDVVTATGRLIRSDGQPVSHATIRINGEDESPIITGGDGSFAWETPADLRVKLDGTEVETDLNLTFEFDGTDHFAPASSNLDVTVGIPRVVVEPVQPVARGDAATLRGIVLIGTRAVPDTEISTGPDVQLRSNELGSFTSRYPIDADAGLGASTIVIDTPEIGVSTTAPITVKSASSLIVAPLDEVHPGKLVPLQAILLDDTGAGIPQATLRTNQGTETVTDSGGVALLELTVPESGDLFAVPVTFRFDGDDRHMPLVYFLGIPITYPRFNWLLWAGMPALIMVVVLAAYVSRRVTLADLPGPFRRGADSSTSGDTGAAPTSGPPFPGQAEGDPEPQETHLDISFGRLAPDLPDVWGIGEPVPVRIRLSTADNQPIPQASIDTHVPGILPPGTLLTEGQGICAFVWDGNDQGQFLVSASFADTPEYLSSSASRSFRVVEFRAEIVRLYNDFLEWSQVRVTGISDQATPREVESTLVTSGLPIDQRHLDEVISRFEEADYSEHPITRQQYESMYRAWRAVVGD